MKLFLARHGSVNVIKGTFYGSQDVPLSEFGIQQAQEAAQVLASKSPDRVISSPLSRALFEANLVGDLLNQQVQVEPALVELDRGSWSGLSLEEVEANWPGQWQASLEDPEGWNGHGGESFGTLRKRVVGCVQNLVNQGNEDETCVLVAHLWPIATLLEFAGCAARPTFNEKRIPKGSISSIQFKAGAWITDWFGQMPADL